MSATVKHQPATPLPLRLFMLNGVLEIAPPPPAKLGERPCVIGWPGFDANDLTHGENEQNAAYLVHAANAYPKLVEALRQALERKPMFAQTYHHCRALLRELGEAP